MVREIVEKAGREVEQRIVQAVQEDRQERITRTMVLLKVNGYSYDWICDSIQRIFDERYTLMAVKMRVHNALKDEEQPKKRRRRRKNAKTDGAEQKANEA
ncbi:hypothetical protein JXA32_05200 [Candidatus Sumerlaeota bacterium]|nr:hypothetical protein [Candidatus Sumerlaeota bacterium]